MSFIAVIGLQEAISRSSIFSLQWTVQSLFSWLDGANKWTEGPFTLFFFQIIMLYLDVSVSWLLCPFFLFFSLSLSLPCVLFSRG